MSSVSEHNSTITRSSLSTLSNERKKRKNNSGEAVATTSKPVDRINKSHTTYFFHKDSDNNEIAYCVLCERKLTGTDKNSYLYSRKEGSTSNLTSHLRDKHGITKFNYLEYLDTNNEVKTYIKKLHVIVFKQSEY